MSIARALGRASVSQLLKIIAFVRTIFLLHRNLSNGEDDRFSTEKQA
jgi:hypothetical protein